MIPRRQADELTTLGQFLEDYIASRKDVKPASKVVWGHVVRDLKSHFGSDRDVRTITAGNADDFKQFLIGRKLAPTTVHKRLQTARSFFLAMRRRKIISENPFDGVKSAAIGTKDRQRFIPSEDIDRVIGACPDHHWKLMVALARYGGLRCPSEVLSLRWQDIDWESGRITVTSPKTEHHAGGSYRVIPLFAELQPYLSESFELALDGEEFVIDPKYRRAATGPGGWINANLRTTFLKIIRRAGLKPWPRPWHNLRASRETELVEHFPVQAVTSWLGNTPTIAMKHYLMVTSDHFSAAIRGDAKSGAESGAVSARTGAQGAASEWEGTRKPLFCRGWR